MVRDTKGDVKEELRDDVYKLIKEGKPFLMHDYSKSTPTVEVVLGANGQRLKILAVKKYDFKDQLSPVRQERYKVEFSFMTHDSPSDEFPLWMMIGKNRKDSNASIDQQYKMTGLWDKETLSIFERYLLRDTNLYFHLRSPRTWRHTN